MFSVYVIVYQLQTYHTILWRHHYITVIADVITSLRYAVRLVYCCLSHKISFILIILRVYDNNEGKTFSPPLLLSLRRRASALLAFNITSYKSLFRRYHITWRLLPRHDICCFHMSCRHISSHHCLLSRTLSRHIALVYGKHRYRWYGPSLPLLHLEALEWRGAEVVASHELTYAAHKKPLRWRLIIAQIIAENKVCCHCWLSLLPCHYFLLLLLSD